MATTNGKSKPERKKVVVVGAGAAGMSCAHHPAEHPDKFEITLMDAIDYCDGQAHIFHHTMTMSARYGYHVDPVKLQISFGKDDVFWSNVFPTQLLARHQKEIKRFKRMLAIVRWFEVCFALLRIKYLMKLFWFSVEFCNTIILSMVALFLGTGNCTTEVLSIILERLCTNPTYGMWYPAENLTVASNLHPWWSLTNSARVSVRLSTELTKVVKKDKGGVIVRQLKRTPTGDGHNPNSAWVPHDSQSNAEKNAQEIEEHYAFFWGDTLRLPSQDFDYMEHHYQNFYNPDQAVNTLSGVDQTTRNQMAQKSFKPMYMMKTNPKDHTKLEICFDCTNYQSQFSPGVPFKKHVFQTIFLSKQRDGHLWTIDEIDESQIIRKNCWHQLFHSKHTRSAAAWTLVNAHEVAVISGITMEVDLGARYPENLERDRFALPSFRLKAAKEGEGRGWASGIYGSVYKGPGVVEQKRLAWEEENGIKG
ncbi:hypothetical protein K469DRAFT_735456 [Zopfia rhizophila CBS 207.26]|uniref:FAD/NAD(P)-binding domain-containing protein n=1 Tax=Zopfia rhizophila CBS 207.26 TaxID=1314779 RepID=A0A6A6EMG1_9PEZI|nr:hypothetical protein K469DRAFT_735456 [Zopfia rhizophila CBS 207.26]